MGAKTAFVRARIEPALKNRVEQIFNVLGISTTQVITMLYKYIERERTIPFNLSIPNRETARAIKEARKGKGVVACEDVNDMFERLGLLDAETDL